MKLSYKISAALAAGSLIATLLAPSAFATVDSGTGINISGNGADSYNKVKIYNSNKCTVKQSNSSTIVNSVGVKSKTGKNKASKNTGGTTSITTGDTTTTVGVGVSGSTNSADNPCCACAAPSNPDPINITENGADSTNKVDISNSNTTKITQTNTSSIVNTVNVSSNTGGNTAKSNTGGDVSIDTGSTTTTVGIEVTGSSNSLGTL